MSIRAAIRAAPTKKLTASEPQAGRRRHRWGQSALGTSQVQRERDGGHRAPEEEPGAAVGEHLDARVGGGEGQDHTGEGRGEEQGAGQVGLAGDRAQPRRSTSGRLAVRVRTRNRAPARWRPADRGQPAGVAGERHEDLPEGHVAQQRWWSEEHQGARAEGDEEQGRARPVEPAAPGGGPAGEAETATARTRPTTRLTAKMNRQSATESTTAPKRGPSTLPISWTADTTPRGIPRRSTGRGRRPGPASPAPDRRRRRPGGSARAPSWACRRPAR